MSSRSKSLLNSVLAAKWWFLGPVLAVGALMAALMVLGGGSGAQGFSYF